MKTLVLASTSPYRRMLLARLGVVFEALPPTIDETPLPVEKPQDLARRLAELKARVVSAPGRIVIGADQVASLEHRILRKPGSHAAALEQLTSCQGKIVSFHTAVCIIEVDSGRTWDTVDRTEVLFGRRDEAELDLYLRIEQPYDCAGGFKAEGLGIVLFEEVRSSDPTALIGLPLIWVANTLKQAGIDPLEPASALDKGV